MMRSLWISKTGMEAQQTQLDAISNNLANVSTNGYKKSHAVFEDLMYQNIRQAGANSTDQTTLPTGLQLGLGTRAVATAYLEYLYSPPGQEIAARHFYRPIDPAIAAKYAAKFPKISLFTIDEVFGGWAKAQKTHFADGGVFDQIYTAK
jgi:hypothetical protein